MSKKAYVIHLARAAGRFPYVQRLIKDCPIETEIVDAVDGAELSAEEIAAVYAKDLHQPRYPFTLRPAEIGCFLSHRICWQKIADEKLDYGLVFEDDAGIETDALNAAIALAEQHIDAAGYIQLPVREKPVKARLVAEADGTRLLVPEVTPLRLSGQLISNRAAQRLLQMTREFDRPVDTFLQMHWITKVAPMFVRPSGLTDYTAASGGSTIGQRKSLIDRAQREYKRMAYRGKIRRLSRRHAIDH